MGWWGADGQRGCTGGLYYTSQMCFLRLMLVVVKWGRWASAWGLCSSFRDLMGGSKGGAAGPACRPAPHRVMLVGPSNSHVAEAFLGFGACCTADGLRGFPELPATGSLSPHTPRDTVAYLHPQSPERGPTAQGCAVGGEPRHWDGPSFYG